MIRLAKAHTPVSVLGWGERVSIWMQGCSIGCQGCLSRDTWGEDDATLVALNVVVSWLVDSLPGCDGLTISGGEPFDQPEAIEALAAAARSADNVCDIDVLVYSGYGWAELQERHPAVLNQVDGVISEPFEADLIADDGWRGSRNQEFHALTELGQARRPKTWAIPGKVQVHVDEQSVWFVGIPRHGDLSRMESDLKAEGILLDDVSWRP